MNTVGPYHNRQETYAYFSLPFCQGPKTGLGHYHETFGEALLGVELELSGLDMSFKRERERTVYCEVKVAADEKLEAFEYAVRNQYWYQLYLDDLPAWGLVGELDENADAYIYTHRRFDIGYNANQVVELNLTTSDRMRLQSGAVLRFTFEVKWHASQIEFKHRFNKYLDPNFFQHRIHWFSIFNSFMMVIFLVGLVAMILMRTLRKDYARYAARESDEFDDLEHDLGDEYGWKQVHGDVFRAPARPVIFSSVIGCGAQIFTISLLSIALIIVGEFWIERGTIITLIIFLYAVSAPINGFIGGSLYSRIGGW
jgi:transmembrane 9 superfamily protein 3